MLECDHNPETCVTDDLTALLSVHHDNLNVRSIDASRNGNHMVRARYPTDGVTRIVVLKGNVDVKTRMRSYDHDFQTVDCSGSECEITFTTCPIMADIRYFTDPVRVSIMHKDTGKRIQTERDVTGWFSPRMWVREGDYEVEIKQGAYKMRKPYSCFSGLGLNMGGWSCSVSMEHVGDTPDSLRFRSIQPDGTLKTAKRIDIAPEVEKYADEGMHTGSTAVTLLRGEYEVAARMHSGGRTRRTRFSCDSFGVRPVDILAAEPDAMDVFDDDVEVDEDMPRFAPARSNAVTAVAGLGAVAFFMAAAFGVAAARKQDRASSLPVTVASV